MRIHHLALRTRDLPRLSLFYREVLGLPRVRRRGEEAEWLALGPDAVLMIERATTAEPEPPPGSMELVAFAVSPIERDAVLARLTRRGGSIEAATAHTRYFRDPDGRRVAVSTYPLPEPSDSDPESGIQGR